MGSSGLLLRASERLSFVCGAALEVLRRAGREAALRLLAPSGELPSEAGAAHPADAARARAYERGEQAFGRAELW